MAAAAKSVYVGMSGGVDSSVAAMLLQRQGYQVTGVYMKNWTKDLPGMICPWAEDLADAKRVAVSLGVELKVYDFERQYRQLVVDYMIREYQAGRTPNPDVVCNQEVKFKLFLEAALKGGAELIATGHYARAAGRRLLRAADEAKDQTYFMYRITGRALSRLLLPVGDLTKPQVRRLAAERQLATAGKKDSQGICFVGEVGIKQFLKPYVSSQSGWIIESGSGSRIGRHDGAIFYTLGQRRGLGVGGGLPYYVVGKDMDKNEVYVSRDLNDRALWRDRLELAGEHWISGRAPDTDKPYLARLRHRAPLVPARLKRDGPSGRLSLELAEPQRAVAPGQSAVIYDDQVCLGGGVVV